MAERQILWVNTTQLLWLAGVTVLLLAALALGWVQRLFGFQAHLHSPSASVQLAGMYLVFASLIIPALGTRAHRGALRHGIAYGIGAMVYALGLALSALFDLPSGAVIVWTLAACAMLAACVLHSNVAQT